MGTSEELGQRFAHAHDRLERRRVHRVRLLRYQRVRFILMLTPFGMPEDDVAHRKFLEHHRRDFTRKRADVVLAHVLRAQAQVGVQDGFGHFAQGGERRADHDVHLLHVRQLDLQAPDEVQRLRHGLVHLPVAGDNQFSFFIHVLKT